MTTQPRLRVGSLFAGIGGFDLAAERAGMEVVWQSEWAPPTWQWADAKAKKLELAAMQGIDPDEVLLSTHPDHGVRDGRWIPDGQWAAKVLDYRWPAVPNLGDIHGITTAPGVDVLTGGFPCQDYSVAGNRGGLAGDRGALWWEYHRLIVELRPTWVVGENVPGLLSSRGGADFETIVGSLTECGYGVAWAVLDAQYFGVAQRRRRVFIVGHSGGVPRPEVLALGEGVFGHPEPRRKTGEATAPTLAARTRGGGWPGIDEAIDGALAFMWQAGGDNSASGAWEHEHTPTLPMGQTIAVAATLTQGAPTAGRRNEDDVNLVAFAQNQRDELRELDQAGSLNAERWGTAKNETLLAEIQTRGRGDEIHDEIDTSGVAQSLRAGDGGSSRSKKIVTTSSVRRLTPLECERLQGFPDGWTDSPGNSDTQRYRQLGNAVAVPVVEWIMNRLVEVSK